MTYLLFFLGAVVFLILIFLVIPINLQGYLLREEELIAGGKISWAGGLLVISFETGKEHPFMLLSLFGISKSFKKTGEKQIKHKPNKKENTKNNNYFSKGSISHFINKQLLAKVFQLLYRAGKALNLRLSLSGEYGTGDPALTGYLTAFMASLNQKQYQIYLFPNFSEEVLHFRGDLKARIVPAKFLWLATGFMLSAPVRQIWWAEIKRKHIFRRN